MKNKKTAFGIAAWALSMMVLAVGCGTETGDEANGEADGEEETVEATADALTAPSCIRIVRTWTGGCQQGNFQVTNSCSHKQRVKVDVKSFPDTACKTVAAGQTMTFTTECNPFGHPLRMEARGLKSC